MTQCWLHGTAPGPSAGCAGSPAQWGEPGWGGRRTQGQRPLLHGSWNSASPGWCQGLHWCDPRCCGCQGTAASGPTGSARPFGRGDLHVRPRGRRRRVPPGSGQDSAQLSELWHNTLTAGPRGSWHPGSSTGPAFRVSWAAPQLPVSPRVPRPCTPLSQLALPCTSRTAPKHGVGSVSASQGSWCQ